MESEIFTKGKSLIVKCACGRVHTIKKDADGDFNMETKDTAPTPAPESDSPFDI